MKLAEAVVWLSGIIESTVVVAEQSVQHDSFGCILLVCSQAGTAEKVFTVPG
jgi:hypothetical protein